MNKWEEKKSDRIHRKENVRVIYHDAVLSFRHSPIPPNMWAI